VLVVSGPIFCCACGLPEPPSAIARKPFFTSGRRGSFNLRSSLLIRFAGLECRSLMKFSQISAALR
jgi:hypothetical protein